MYSFYQFDTQGIADQQNICKIETRDRFKLATISDGRVAKTFFYTQREAIVMIYNYTLHYTVLCINNYNNNNGNPFWHKCAFILNTC